MNVIVFILSILPIIYVIDYCLVELIHTNSKKGLWYVYLFIFIMSILLLCFLVTYFVDLEMEDYNNTFGNFCDGTIIYDNNYHFCDGKPFICNDEKCNYITIGVDING